MGAHPLISVIVPTYKVAAYIGETISSVLSQSYSNFELIIVDDCSPDNTLEVVNSFKDSRIRVIQNLENVGAGATRTNGLRAARGGFVALLDSDDRWYPDKLQKQMQYMLSNGVDITYTRYDIMDENSKVYGDCGKIPSKATYRSLLSGCFIRTSSLVFNYEKIGRDIEFSKMKRRQDFVFFLSLLKRSGAADLVGNEPMCSYRTHEESISSSKMGNIPFQWSVYREHEGLSLFHSVYLMVNWFFKSGFVVVQRKVMAAA